jgi:hypothetical protein
MIHTYEVEGLRVQTGDLLCTTDGGGADITGQFWRLIGDGNGLRLILALGRNLIASTIVYVSI